MSQNKNLQDVHSLNVCDSILRSRSVVEWYRKELEFSDGPISSDMYHVLREMDLFLFLPDSSSFLLGDRSMLPDSLPDDFLFVIAGMALLDLKPGHSFLAIDANTGLANQLAAPLLGPHSLNVGLTSSDRLQQCRAITGVIRRLNPAWEQSSSLPIFTDQDDEAVNCSRRTYDRILVVGSCPNRDQLGGLQEVLAEGGRFVARCHVENRQSLQEFVIGQSCEDRTFKQESVSNCGLLLQRFLHVTRFRDFQMTQYDHSFSAQASFLRSPASLSQLAMQSGARCDILKPMKEALGEDFILRGFHRHPENRTSLSIAGLIDACETVAKPEWRLKLSHTQADTRLAKMTTLCCDLADKLCENYRPDSFLTQQQRCLRATVVHTVVQARSSFMLDCLQLDHCYSELNLGALFLHRNFLLPLALGRRLADSGWRFASTVVRRPMRQELTENLARLVSDVSALQRLLQSDMASHILHFPTKHREWAKLCASFIAHHERMGKDGRTPVLNGLQPSFNVFISEAFRTKPASNAGGLAIALEALINSVRIRKSIHFEQLKTEGAIDSDLFVKELERLNSDIPRDMQSANNGIHDFLGARFLEDVADLVARFEEENLELQFVSLARDPQLFLNKILSGYSEHTRLKLLSKVDAETCFW